MLLLVRFCNGPPDAAPPHSLEVGTYQVRRVIDGDTILFEPHTTVRLIGVDTPETVKPEHPIEPWGKEATAFTREFLSAGQARLTFDRERVDQFGRTLAYVWVSDQMLNEELLRGGLARFESHFRYSQDVKNRFRRAQQEAKDAGRGIWSHDSP